MTEQNGGDQQEKPQNNEVPGTDNNESTDPAQGDPTQSKEPEVFPHVVNYVHGHNSPMNIGEGGQWHFASGSGSEGESYVRTTKAILLAPEVINKIDQVFVASDDYSFITGRMKQYHFSILQGLQGIGKLATAIHLGNQRFSHKRIYELSPSETIEDLKTFPCHRKQSVFILASAAESFFEIPLAKDTKQMVKPVDLQEVAQHFADNDCYLIITTTAQVNIPYSQLIVRMDTNTTPRLGTIFEKHIEYYASRTNMTLANVEEYIQENHALYIKIDFKGSLHRLDRIAEGVVQAAAGLRTLDSVVYEYADVTQDDARRLLLEANTTAADRCFVIAMAMFEGLRTDQIERVAHFLTQIMPDIGQQVKEDDTQVYDPLRERVERLERCECESIMIVETTYVGRIEVQGWKFKKASMAENVLQFVWKRLPELHSRLLGWLYGIGSSGEEANILDALKIFFADNSAKIYDVLKDNFANRQIRARAAIAAGELLRQEFHTVSTQLLHRWIQGSHDTRLLTAQAMVVPLYDENHANNVLNVAKHWLTLRDKNRNFQRTGILCYGIIGSRYLPEALENLHAYYLKHDGALLDTIRDAVNTIHILSEQEAGRPVYLPVFDYLQEWIEGDNPQTRAFAVEIFLIFCHPEITNPKTELDWPLPLVVALRSKVHHHAVTVLFLAAIRNPKTQARALHYFIKWSEFANEEWAGLAQTWDTLIRGMYQYTVDHQLERDRIRLMNILQRNQDNPFINRFLRQEPL